MRLSTLFKIFSNSLITYTLFTRRIALFYVGLFFLFLCAGDMAKSRVCDRVNQIAIVDLHLREGTWRLLIGQKFVLK